MDRRSRILAIVAASAGNLVEWFDFYVYAFTTIYFADAFFPAGDPTVRLLDAAGVFAAGFLMRPVGSFLFGRIADRRGRKTAMTFSVLLMCCGSLAIACAPTYARVGAWAPAYLLIARLFQGLSVGGEYGTSATYMSEVAVAGERGFLASFQYVTLIGGQLLALLVVVVLEHVLGADALRAWGWRIPFMIGALTAVSVFYLRRSLDETATRENLAREESGTLGELFVHHKRAFFTVLGFTAGGSLGFYTFTTYMQKYLVNTAHMDAKRASVTMTFALFLTMCMQPVFGALSDRIGRKAMMLGWSGLGLLFTWPILAAIRSGGGSHAIVWVLAALAIVSLYTSISGLIKAEMFPPEVRALGVGLSYAIGNAIFGGSAEYVALRLKTMGREEWFFAYVSAMCGIAFLVSVSMPDLRKLSYLSDEG